MTYHPMRPQTKGTRKIGRFQVRFFITTGYQITERWPKLLSLTFIEEPQEGNQQLMFTNYNSIDNVIMKMLVVIKSQNLKDEEKELRDFFGNEKINTLISNNQYLNALYRQTTDQRRHSSQNNSSYVNGYRSGY